MSYDFEMPPHGKGVTVAQRKAGRIAMGEAIERLSRSTGYKFGPRGWAYYAEGLGLITKGEFDRFESLLTSMRKAGELDHDVIEPDASRIATEVYDFEAATDTVDEQADYAVSQIGRELNLWASAYQEHGYWDGLEHYVEMIVEKKDLVQIFQRTANRFNVRITNGKGDTDIHSRLAMLKRFRDHYYEGRRPILLAIGDHDPKGLYIVEGLQRTLMSCANIKGLEWPELQDPEDFGLEPEDLFQVVNIGLTEHQIEDLGLMKIENLETGGGKDLSDPSHADYDKPYVQRYIRRFGVWKCEANALVGDPAGAEQLLEDAITEFVPIDHPQDIKERNAPAQDRVRDRIAELMKDWKFDD